MFMRFGVGMKFEGREISVRAYNVLQNADIGCSNELIRFYYQWGSFKKIRNCGDGTNRTLIALSKELIASQSDAIWDDSGLDYLKNQVHEEEHLERIRSKSLTKKQEQLLSALFKQGVVSLSVRSKNIVSYCLKDDFGIYKVYNKFFSASKVNIFNLVGSGRKTGEEIGDFLDRFQESIRSVLISPERNSEELMILNIRNIFPGFHENINHQSIIGLVDALLKNNIFFNRTRDNYVFKMLNGLFEYKEGMSFDDVAEMTLLTRERVRQLDRDLLKEFICKISCLTAIDIDLGYDGVTGNDMVYFLDEKSADAINRRNKTSLSSLLITYILSGFYQENYSCCGKITKTQDGSRRKNYSEGWKNMYLINRKVSDTFDILGIIEECKKHNKKSRAHNETVNLAFYLERHKTGEGCSSLDVTSVVGEILFYELGIIIDNDKIVYCRNSKKQNHEYVYEALEKIDHPAHVNEITEMVNHLYPDKCFTSGQVRASMRRKHGFVPFGRISIFGLKKWDNDTNIKGGTIREIVKELLFRKKQPLGIAQITDHVVKFRPRTNAKNILSNLKLQRNNEFVYFNQGFIGLKVLEHVYDIEKYNRLPKMLGKTLNSLRLKGCSGFEIDQFLASEFALTEDEIYAIKKYHLMHDDNML